MGSWTDGQRKRHLIDSGRAFRDCASLVSHTEHDIITSLKGCSDLKQEGFRSTLMPLVIITIGGLLALGICYLLFLLTNHLARYLVVFINPSSMPPFIVRRVFALVLLALYLVLLRAKLSDLAKSTLLVGPMGILFSTAMITLYQTPAWAIAVTVFILAISIFLLHRSMKPWFYYYAIAIALLVSIALAWPRA